MTNSDIALQNSNGSPKLGAGSQDRGAGSGIQLNLTAVHIVLVKLSNCCTEISSLHFFLSSKQPRPQPS